LAFAVGIALGLTIGAGTALLFAPQTGTDTRRAIVRKGRRLSQRGSDAWDDLRDELSRAARRGRQAFRRRRQRSKESAAD
jgi:gas vesicle protein